VLRLLLSLASVAFLAFAGGAKAEGVALTFDDLPGMSLSGSAPYVETTTKSLLAGLRRGHLPATGFVIGERLDGAGAAENIKLVDLWLDAGVNLGNHTYSHESLNKTPVEDYIADVSRADGLLRPRLAAHADPLRWFRHPYLETGLTLEARQTFEAWLSAHNYRVAPVTMENSDWMFALPYDAAILRNDKPDAERIRQAYLDYTTKAVVWYRAAAYQLLGRRLDFVFLLHATRLNADSIAELAKILRRNNLHPISLERAMRDPAYKISDTYVGPDGDEWLSRWSRTLHKDLPWESFPEPPADIAAQSERLDTSP